jgi:hypothetical protein
MNKIFVVHTWWPGWQARNENRSNKGVSRQNLAVMDKQSLFPDPLLQSLCGGE